MMSEALEGGNNTTQVPSIPRRTSTTEEGKKGRREEKAKKGRKWMKKNKEKWNSKHKTQSDKTRPHKTRDKTTLLHSPSLALDASTHASPIHDGKKKVKEAKKKKRRHT
jgi:hypothetical protein